VNIETSDQHLKVHNFTARPEASGDTSREHLS